MESTPVGSVGCPHLCQAALVGATVGEPCCLGPPRRGFRRGHLPLLHLRHPVAQEFVVDGQLPRGPEPAGADLSVAVAAARMRWGGESDGVSTFS